MKVNERVRGMMKKILLIDDEPDHVEVLKYCLKAKGYRVFTATDGVEGFAKAMHEEPDLIVLDVIMRHLDGYSFVKEFNKRRELRGIPIVVITGRDQLQELFRSQGINHYFVKPFETKDVLARIKGLLESK